MDTVRYGVRVIGGGEEMILSQQPQYGPHERDRPDLLGQTPRYFHHDISYYHVSHHSRETNRAVTNPFRFATPT